MSFAKGNEWKEIKLKDIACKIKAKNKDSVVRTVFSNSAINGIVEQGDYFKKDIANKNNISNYYIIENDDFVYNPRISASAPYGPIKRNNTGKTGVVSPLYTVFRLDRNKCNISYFQQYFHSSIWYKYMYSVANYGARADRMNITDSDLFDMRIIAPSISQQQKIAVILSTWDKAIKLKEKLIEQKKEQKKGLMQKLLSGEVRLPGFDGEWKEVILNQIGKTYSGLSGKTAADFGTGKPYIPYKTIFDGATIDVHKVGFVDIENNEKQSKVEKGDIFFTTSSETPNEVGMSSVLLDEIEEMYLNSFCFGYRLYDFATLLPEYARFLFRGREFRRKIYSLAQGSTRFNISKKELLKLRLLLPPVAEQKMISNVLGNWEIEISLLEKETEQLKEQKKGLMQLLLTGKVRVRV